MNETKKHWRHHEHQDISGEINIGGKGDGHRLFQSNMGFFFHSFRVQTTANVVHVTACEDRTPRRTHIFLSVAHI